MLETYAEEIYKLPYTKEGQFFDVSLQNHRQNHCQEAIFASYLRNWPLLCDLEKNKEREIDDGYRGQNSDEKATLVYDKAASEMGVI